VAGILLWPLGRNRAAEGKGLRKPNEASGLAGRGATPTAGLPGERPHGSSSVGPDPAASAGRRGYRPPRPTGRAGCLP
jgi:hypothetical protein